MICSSAHPSPPGARAFQRGLALLQSCSPKQAAQKLKTEQNCLCSQKLAWESGLQRSVSLLLSCRRKRTAQKVTAVQTCLGSLKLAWEQGLQRHVTLLLGDVNHLVPELGLLLHHELQAAPRDDGRLRAVHQLGAADQHRQAPAGQHSPRHRRLQGYKQALELWQE